MHCQRSKTRQPSFPRREKRLGYRSLLRFCALPTVALMLGCGASQGSTAGAERAGESADAQPLSELQRLNRRARAGAVVETHFGVEVQDPYRALEQDSALSEQWVDAQNERTRARLAEWTDTDTAERIGSLLSIGTLDSPRMTDSMFFYKRRDAEREQPALYARSLEGQELGEERTIFDPLAAGERVALDWFYPSPSGRYVAIGLSTNGDERSTLQILDMRQVLGLSSDSAPEDRIEHTKWSQVAWLNDESGFYYRRYPAAGEPDYDAEHADTYHQRVYFHTLDTESAEDTLVFTPPNRTDFPAISISGDDRWVAITNYRGWSASDVHLLDRGASRRRRVAAPDQSHPMTPIVVGADHLTSAHLHGDLLFLTTDEDAPRSRVFRVAPARASERERWREIIAEGPGAIADVVYFSSSIAVHTTANIRSQISIYDLEGHLQSEVQLPGVVSVSGLSAASSGDTLAYGLSGFSHPPSLQLWNEEGSREVAAIEADYDFSTLETSQAEVRSADGTSVNVYYVHPRGMDLDGSNRVLLTGYGGFGVSLLPSFQRNALYWVERGGVYAVANLRGGGELGESWHRAGNLANKERVFEDFEAVIRFFGEDSSISSPDRIAITGGSNGGLLMGAMLTRAPSTFGATVSNVGLYDMLRYHLFPPAELWISEYGSPEDEAQFAWLRSYSPYHNVQDSTHVPATLITTADHDSRVHSGHSAKFAALLQEASGEADPDVYYFRVEQQGHGAGGRRSDIVDRYVRLYSFIEHHLAL